MTNAISMIISHKHVWGAMKMGKKLKPVSGKMRIMPSAFKRMFWSLLAKPSSSS